LQNDNLQIGWANTETTRFMHPLLFSPILGSSFSGMKDCCYRLSSDWTDTPTQKHLPSGN